MTISLYIFFDPPSVKPASTANAMASSKASRISTSGRPRWSKAGGAFDVKVQSIGGIDRGDRRSPKDSGCGSPFQMAFLWLTKMGGYPNQVS